MLLLSPADFFQTYFFFLNSFRNTIGVSNSLDLDQVLIWVQSVCKGYQQMTQVAASKEKVCLFVDLIIYVPSIIFQL